MNWPFGESSPCNSAAGERNDRHRLARSSYGERPHVVPRVCLCIQQVFAIPRPVTREHWVVGPQQRMIAGITAGALLEQCLTGQSGERNTLTVRRPDPKVAPIVRQSPGSECPRQFHAPDISISHCVVDEGESL